MTGRELAYCFECSEYPCKLIKRLEKSYNTRCNASLMENSKIVKTQGMDAFLKQQKDKYTCPECGGIISIHDAECSECQYKTPAEKKMSCCGTICSDCEYYPADCQGCSEIKGRVFWLEYTRESCCDIYDCCINQRKHEHCGQCEELPCSRYERDDPTKTKEENEADHLMQIKNLKERMER